MINLIPYKPAYTHRSYGMGFTITFRNEQEKEEYYKRTKRLMETNDLKMGFEIIYSLINPSLSDLRIKKQFKRFCSLGRLDIASKFLKQLKENNLQTQSLEDADKLTR